MNAGINRTIELRLGDNLLNITTALRASRYPNYSGKRNGRWKWCEESPCESSRHSYHSIVESVNIEWQGSSQLLPIPFAANVFFIIQSPIVMQDEPKFRASIQDVAPDNAKSPATMMNSTIHLRS